MASTVGKGFATVVKEIWDRTLKPKLDKALQESDIQIGNFPDNRNDIAEVERDRALYLAATAQKVKLSNAWDTLKQKSSAFVAKVFVFEKLKQDYRSDMQELGRHLDELSRKGNGLQKGVPTQTRFQDIMTFLSEEDTFVAQAELAEKQGEEELRMKIEVDEKQGAKERKRTIEIDNAATRASKALDKVNPTDGSRRTIYLAYKWTSKKNENYLESKWTEWNSKGTKKGTSVEPTGSAATSADSSSEGTEKGTSVEHIGIQEQQFELYTGKNPSVSINGPNEAQAPGSAEGTRGYGVNQVMEMTLEQVRSAKGKIIAYRDKLRNAMGF